MSRLSQVISYLNIHTSDLTNDWIKTNLTDLTITESLKKLRKTRNKQNKELWQK